MAPTAVGRTSGKPIVSRLEGEFDEDKFDGLFRAGLNFSEDNFDGFFRAGVWSLVAMGPRCMLLCRGAVWRTRETISSSKDL